MTEPTEIEYSGDPGDHTDRMAMWSFVQKYMPELAVELGKHPRGLLTPIKARLLTPEQKEKANAGRNRNHHTDMERARFNYQPPFRAPGAER